MSSQRRNRIRELFDAAVSIPRQQREEFLDARCGDDTELRSELRSLLEAHDESSGFLSSPALERQLPDEPPRAVPERIGHYRVLSVLGEGGMGTVYEAEQESPHRRVALKVVSGAIRSPRVWQRFHLEAELLARLQHPGIAQIFEAGTFSDDGVERPYIAMELIEGVRLTDYVEKHELPVRERLRLMAEICDAVHHAHQKSVIHRDLKPANILVDASGCPKILDFGIAAATDSDLNLTTAGTELGQLLGTLPYMSPEQVQGKPGEIDTRSDVYALGVICYRLLAGRLPLDLRQVAIVEAARVIAEQEPEPLSDFNRTLRGDVETIVAKALEKEKKRRYQSASDMGSDIERFLRHETIAARPASTWYQLSTFGARNKGLVVGVAIAILGLLAGLVGMGITLRRTVEAERAARVEADKAGAVSRFFQDVLASVDPGQGPGKETTVRQMLDGAAADLESSFENQPEVRAVLHDTIGLTYRNIGNLEDARTHLEEALAILEDDPAADRETTASTMNHLAGLYWRLDLPEEAESLVRRALAIRTELYGGMDERTLELQGNLGILLSIKGDLSGAAELARLTLEARREAGLDPNDPSLLTSMNNLASILEELGNVAEAEPLFVQVLEARRESLGDLHPLTLTSIHNMARFYESNSKPREAERLAREALAGNIEIYDQDHPDALRSLDVLIYALAEQEKLGEAEPLARDLLDRRTRALGAEHRDTIGARQTLVMVLRKGEAYPEAERLSRGIVVAFDDRLGEEHPRTLAARHNLAQILLATGELDEAIESLAEITRLADEVLPEAHRYRYIFREKLGNGLTQAGRFAEAETVLLRALELTEEQNADPEVVIAELAELFDAWERPDEAERWRSKLE